MRLTIYSGSYPDQFARFCPEMDLSLFDVREMILIDINRVGFFSQTPGDFKKFTYNWLDLENSFYLQGDMFGSFLAQHMFDKFRKQLPDHEEYDYETNRVSFGYVNDTGGISGCLIISSPYPALKNDWVISILHNATALPEDRTLHVISSIKADRLEQLFPTVAESRLTRQDVTIQSSAILRGLQFRTDTKENMAELLSGYLQSEAVTQFVRHFFDNNSQVVSFSNEAMQREGYTRDRLITKLQAVKAQEKKYKIDVRYAAVTAIAKGSFASHRLIIEKNNERKEAEKEELLAPIEKYLKDRLEKLQGLSTQSLFSQRNLEFAITSMLSNIFKIKTSPTPISLKTDAYRICHEHLPKILSDLENLRYIRPERNGPQMNNGEMRTLSPAPPKKTVSSTPPPIEYHF